MSDDETIITLSHTEHEKLRAALAMLLAKPEFTTGSGETECWAFSKARIDVLCQIANISFKNPD